MQKGDTLPKMQGRMAPGRRMSMFTASQTLRVAAGWSQRTRSERRDSRRESIMRRDSERTDGSSVQPSTKAVVRLENTFKINPDDGTQFKAWKIQKTVDEILREMLVGKKYDPIETARLGLQIASILKQHCKDLGCPRFKFVSHVVIGENKNQSLESASRGIWDDHFDGFVCGTFKNESIFAIATVFALYYE